jgi:hypothetical protein
MRGNRKDRKLVFVFSSFCFSFHCSYPGSSITAWVQGGFFEGDRQVKIEEEGEAAEWILIQDIPAFAQVNNFFFWALPSPFWG